MVYYALWILYLSSLVILHLPSNVESFTVNTTDRSILNGDITTVPIEIAQTRGAEADMPHLQMIRLMQAGWKLTLYRVGLGIHTYYSPIVCIVGLVGNTLSAIVMFQKHNRRISTCVYMGILAFLDSVPLLINTKYFFTDVVFPIREGKVGCQVVTYLWAWAGLAGTWTIVAMTADRMYVVKEPLKAIHKCTPKRARIVSLVIILLAGLLKMPYPLVYSRTVPISMENDVCTPLPNRNTPLDELYYWINTVMSCYLPFLLLIAMNSVIVRSLLNRNKNLQFDPIAVVRKAAIDETDKKKKREEAQITMSLLLVAFAFLLLTAPTYIAYIVYMFKDPYVSPHTFAGYMFAGFFTGRLLVTNNAINVFLYGVSGRKFRNDLKAVFGCKISSGTS